MIDFKPLDIAPPRGAAYLADAFSYYIDKAGDIFTWLNRREIRSPDDCKTADELVAYARSIQSREPSFASDLIAAASRNAGK